METRRKQEFKKGINVADGRRTREANMVAIRKDKKKNLYLNVEI